MTNHIALFNRIHRKSPKPLQILVIVLATLGSVAVTDSLADEQPDYEREDRIAAQISEDIFDGEAVWLDADGREFLAIHIAAEDAPGAVILMHGRDSNAEEQEVIAPLRVALAEEGWTTLSIQLPVLEKGKTYYDYVPILPFSHPRIRQAIEFLTEQGEKQIFIAAHSCGAHMANSWLTLNGDNLIDGYIAMGLGATDAGQELKTAFPIGQMRVPVLDLYGSEEFDRPLAMLPQRRRLLEQNGHPASMQRSVEGANHYFTGYGDEVAAIVDHWLNQFKH